MDRRLDLLAVVATISFLGVTVFDIGVHGVLEPSTVMPEHADAGAASPLLPLRALLAAVSAVAGSTALFRAGNRVQSALLGPGIAFVLVWSACGLQRSAANYDERGFMAFIDDGVHSPGTLTSEDALRRLGPPLVAGTVSDEIECWSYTYMPTAGLGWNKRMLLFDRSGKLAGWDIVEEP
jgi:hypothetical protein